MPFEENLWRKGQELREALNREEITEAEYYQKTDEHEQDWEQRKTTVKEQIGVERLRHEALQELVEKGLYSSEESFPQQQERLLGMVTHQKVAERAQIQAEQMPKGEERDIVLSVYNDARDTVYQLRLKYLEAERVTDLNAQGYTMRHDGPNQTKASENLLLAGVIAQEQLRESQMKEAEDAEEAQ